MLTVLLLSSCYYTSQGRLPDPDHVDLKTINNPEFVPDLSAPGQMIKRDSAALVDTLKNEVAGYYRSQYYINKKSGSLSCATRVHHFNGYWIKYFIIYRHNEPTLGEKFMWNERTGIDPSQYARYNFRNDTLYENREGHLVLSDDHIKNVAFKVLQDYSKLL